KCGECAPAKYVRSPYRTLLLLLLIAERHLHRPADKIIIDDPAAAVIHLNALQQGHTETAVLLLQLHEFIAEFHSEFTGIRLEFLIEDEIILGHSNMYFHCVIIPQS